MKKVYFEEIKPGQLFYWNGLNVFMKLNGFATPVVEDTRLKFESFNAVNHVGNGVRFEHNDQVEIFNS